MEIKKELTNQENQETLPNQEQNLETKLFTQEQLEEMTKKLEAQVVGKTEETLNKKPSEALLKDLNGSAEELKEQTQQIEEQIKEVPKGFREKVNNFLSKFNKILLGKEELKQEKNGNIPEDEEKRKLMEIVKDSMVKEMSKDPRYLPFEKDEMRQQAEEEILKNADRLVKELEERKRQKEKTKEYIGEDLYNKAESGEELSNEEKEQIVDALAMKMNLKELNKVTLDKIKLELGIKNLPDEEEILEEGQNLTPSKFNDIMIKLFHGISLVAILSFYNHGFTSCVGESGIKNKHKIEINKFFKKDKNTETEDSSEEEFSSFEELENFIKKNPTIYYINIEDLKNLDDVQKAQKIAEQDAHFFLKHLSFFDKIKGLDIVGEILKFEERHRNIIIYYAQELKNIKGLDLPKIILKFAEEEPENFLSSIGKFIDIPGLNLKKIVMNILEKNPLLFLENSTSCKNIEDIDVMKIKTDLLKKDQDFFVENYLRIYNSPSIDYDGKKIDPVAQVKDGIYKNSVWFFSNLGKFDNIEGINLKEEILEVTKRSSAVEYFENLDIIMSYFTDDPEYVKGEIIRLLEEDAAYALRYPEFRKILKEQQIEKSKVINSISKYIQGNAEGFFWEVLNFVDIDGLDLAKEISKAAEKAPDPFLSVVSDLKGIDGLDLAKEISKAAEKAPGTFLDKISELKDIRGLNLAKEISKAAEKAPKNFLQMVYNFDDINGLDLAKEISKAAGKVPDSFIEYVMNFTNIKNLNLAEELNKATIELPNKFVEYNNINQFNIIKSFNDPKYKAIQVLKNVKNPESTLLFHYMYNNNMSEEEAIKIVNNPKELVDKLIEISAIPNHLGGKFLENKLSEISLKIIQKINELHESPANIRFASIRDISPQSNYTHLVYGEQEVFTSTFNGMFDELMKDMKTQNMGGRDLLDKVGENKYRTFVKECTGFNRLDEFLNTMTEEQANELLVKVISNIEKELDKLSQGVTVAEVLGNSFKIDDPERINILQSQVKSEYERISDDPKYKEEDKILYGLLSSMCNDNAKKDKDWFDQKSKEYPIERVTNIETKELFNEKGICVEKYCFYQVEDASDFDGISSYQNFISSYEKDSKWEIDRSHNEDGFVIIKSKVVNGKSVKIYANIPSKENPGYNGLDKMDEFMKEENDDDPSLYSYRGHSFGFNLDNLKNAKIVNIGSCGGYNNLSGVLDGSPEAHIISTKGTGSKFVNDPIFKMLNEKILTEKNIDWQKFWDNLPSNIKNDKNFNDYVPPHENQGAMFYKSYYELTNKLVEESQNQ